MAKATKAVQKSFWRTSGIVAVIVGLALIGLGSFLFLSFLTGDVGLDPAAAAKTCWTGLFGAWAAYGGIHTFGYVPSVILSLLLVCWGGHVVMNLRFFATWPQVCGGAVIIASASLGVCALSDSYDMNTGGLLAVYVSPPALLYFGRWGLALTAGGAMALGVLLAFGESAVNAVHQFLFSLRDIGLGLGGLAMRLRELFKLLVSPRLAAANGLSSGGGAAVKDRRSPSPASSAGGTTVRKNTSAAAATAAVAEDDEEGSEEDNEKGGTAENAPNASGEANADNKTPAPAGKKPIREWKPRERFVSGFLNLDLRDDSPMAVSEPVQAAIAPAPEQKETPAAPRADVIMDVDAEAEDSDQIVETPVVPEAPAKKRTAVREAVAPAQPEPVAEPTVPAGPSLASLAASAAAAKPRPVMQEAAAVAAPVAAPVSVPASATKAATAATPATASAPRPAAARAAAAPSLDQYRLPSLDLLDPPQPPIVEDSGKIEARAKILEQTLAEFKIEGRVVHIERGPRVTMYELSLAPGIRLNKVTSLADNLAMQLQAESVRIIAPIPGKNTIGIEIPNLNKELVSLREIVGAVNREKRRQALPICLGKDVSGSALVADLSRMPHLLIAGATGSGKSVCINSIILSVMMCCRPDETQLIMIDPKVVELSRFKDIPHLMSPVITDMKRAVSVLEWICQKMDERYEQMSQVSVNNIAKFNALGEEGIRSRLDAFASLEEIEAFPKKMPYMVVIIDELADLMMVSGKDVEQHITRLAAKSRAVGIHLILATQRPSVDVITGLIKANMPCRIAFQVASRVDSRTILDQNGAETLLGQGDMLYLPPGVGKLTRSQGVFVSDEELFRVVDYTKAMAEPQYHADLLGPVIGGSGSEMDVSSFDELFLQSGEAIIENQRGSVSLLQRKFGIGYGRASRIIDQLASAGLLGPFRDGKAREILLTMEEFRAKFGGSGGGGGSFDDDDDYERPAGLRDDERERAGAPWEDDEEA